MLSTKFSLGSVPFQKLWPRIRSVMRSRAEATVDQYILYGLAGDVVPQPAHGLNDLDRTVAFCD